MTGTASPITVTRPIAEVTPTLCSVSGWSVHSTDGIDLADYPTLFDTSSTGDLVLLAAVDDIAERLSLFDAFGNGGNPLGYNFYFEGALSDTDQTKTDKYFFTITLQDPCRSATILPLDIALGTFDWNESGIQDNIAITDTQEDAGGGTCGMKVMTL